MSNLLCLKGTEKLLDRAHIPWSLVMMRLGLGPLIIAGSEAGWSKPLLAGAIIIGVASDIFDGIIARRLGVATPELRRADSLVDLVFWLSVLAAAQHLFDFATRHLILIGLLLASEAGCQIVSITRFGRPPATHSYAAKLWGLVLTAGFAAIFLGRDSGLTGSAMLLFGLLVNLEVIAIMLLSKQQPIDVPSILALRERRSSPKERKHGRVVLGDRL